MNSLKLAILIAFCMLASLGAEAKKSVKKTSIKTEVKKLTALVKKDIKIDSARDSALAAHTDSIVLASFAALSKKQDEKNFKNENDSLLIIISHLNDSLLTTIQQVKILDSVTKITQTNATDFSNVYTYTKDTAATPKHKKFSLRPFIGLGGNTYILDAGYARNQYHSMALRAGLKLYVSKNGKQTILSAHITNELNNETHLEFEFLDQEDDNFLGGGIMLNKNLANSSQGGFFFGTCKIMRYKESTMTLFAGIGMQIARDVHTNDQNLNYTGTSGGVGCKISLAIDFNLFSETCSSLFK